MQAQLDCNVGRVFEPHTRVQGNDFGAADEQNINNDGHCGVFVGGVEAVAVLPHLADYQVGDGEPVAFHVEGYDCKLLACLHACYVIVASMKGSTPRYDN